MNLEEQLNRFLAAKPQLGREVFIARGAVLAGAVTLGDYSSVWYNAVLRADINRVLVGHHTNIQDNAVLHLADDKACVLGNYVTIGHGAVVHACTVRDQALIGMGAAVLDGAVVGECSMVGARSLVTQDMVIPPRTLAFGVPARVIRELREEEIAQLKYWAEKYVRIAAWCRKTGFVPTLAQDLEPGEASIASHAQVAVTP